MTPLQRFLAEVRDIRSSGAAVAETSFYPSLSTLFNEIGKTLRPKVRGLIHLTNRGAGLPDGGFFTADQFGRAITVDEARYVTDTARRLAAILLLQPELDASYQSVCAATYPWPG